MIKVFRLIILFSFAWYVGFAQDSHGIDSLKHELSLATQDTNRVLLMSSLCYDYSNSNTDSARMYGERALALARRVKFYKGEVYSLNQLGRLARILGDIPKGLDLHFNALKVAEDNNNPGLIAGSLNNIGVDYSEFNDYSKAKFSFLKAEKIMGEINDKTISSFKFNLLMNIKVVFENNNQFDSALIYLNKASALTSNLSLDDQAIYLIGSASLQFKLGNYQVALDDLHKSILITQPEFNHRRTAIACNELAGCFNKLGQADSCIHYAKMGLAEAKQIEHRIAILNSSKLLAEVYESKDIQQAYYYLKIANMAKDSLFGESKIRGLQKIISDEQERQRKAEADSIAYRTQLKQYGFSAGLVILLFIAFLLYRNNLREKKAKNQLHEKNKEIQQTFTELKSTQSQLIQSEKMASLGELTAGIAHEIQNPLNFVNNFSEVNREMIDEATEEIDKGNITEVKNILSDIKNNEEKISHHGKRADAIVKGMLQHSKTSTGQKEPTDINALCDEYLRLAYHGIRAKDKDFKADIKTGFDESIGKINVVPQDIGRVLLNLFNNAFYAVSERQKVEGESYKPLVSIQTKKIHDKIQIKAKDNGNGIPQNIIDKIFQPFFTTKPTGQGTGLGLSLAYDIIKAHGGEIKVESKEGEGSEFIIHAPVL